jgi:hypothetical protein
MKRAGRLLQKPTTAAHSIKVGFSLRSKMPPWGAPGRSERARTKPRPSSRVAAGSATVCRNSEPCGWSNFQPSVLSRSFWIPFSEFRMQNSCLRSSGEGSAYGGSHSGTRVRRKGVDQTGPTGAQQGPNQVPPGLDARNGRPLAMDQWGGNHSVLQVIKLLLGAVFHRQHQLFFSPFFLRLCLCSFGRTGSGNIHSFSPSPR